MKFLLNCLIILIAVSFDTFFNKSQSLSIALSLNLLSKLYNLSVSSSIKNGFNASISYLRHLRNKKLGDFFDVLTLLVI